MPPRKVKIEDLRRFVFVSDPQVSPDGGRVAFVHTTIDYPNDGYVKHIWVWDRASKEAAQFTHGPGSDINPRWSRTGASSSSSPASASPKRRAPSCG